MPPEELARQKIDRQLEQCGWIVQDRSAIRSGYHLALMYIPLMQARNPAGFQAHVVRGRRFERVTMSASRSQISFAGHANVACITRLQCTLSRCLSISSSVSSVAKFHTSSVWK
jgi:hypothetical protein